MHILGILLGAIGIALAILWRLNQAADAARGVGEAVGDAHGAWRMWSWNRKSSADQLREVDDPRVAAAVMMVAVAEYDGALTDAEHQVIRQEMTKTFGANVAQPEELIAYARWLNRGGGDIGSVFLKLMPAIQGNCSRRERNDLVKMLKQVDGASGTSEVPANQIAKLEAQLRSA